MRFGCFGCLALLVVVLVVVVAVLGIVFLSGNITTPPDNVYPVRFTRSDGHSAQQKLFELVLRQSGRSSRQDPVVITEPEANGFLANHLAESADLPFSPMSVKFQNGHVEFRGQTPLRNLLQGPPFAQILPYVSDTRLDTPLWVTVKGRIVIEPAAASSSRAYGRMDVSEFALGKQELGAWLLSFMLGSTSSRIFRFQVPPLVQEVQVQDGRIVIVTR
jgi:hypothetical protein